MKTNMKYVSGALLILIYALNVGIANATPVDDLQPGHWYEVPNSQLKAFEPNPLPTGFQSAVMKSWGGGAYDTKRDRLIVWGGGHTNYAGNEVYVFDIETLKWSRITEPSTNVGGDELSGLYPDGNPRSRHSYNYVEYMPNLDRFVSVGTAGSYPGGLSQDKKFFEFDFDSLTWVHTRALAPKGGTVSSLAMYDPKTGHIFRHATMTNSGGLDEYDPGSDTWTSHARYYLRYYMTGALDPVRREIVAVGDGKISLKWDLNNLSAQPVELKTVGDKYLETATAPGFVYDPVSKKYVGWSGGADVFVLDSVTLEWTRVKPAATNNVIPTAAQKNGTYGRFRYIPSKNAFITVNSTTGNVYFYKLTASDGLPLWPNVLINASKTTVLPGDSVTLTWSSTNAKTCAASNAWSGSKATSGSVVVGPINADSTFTLTCTGDSGTSSSAVSVKLNGDFAKPYIASVIASGNPNSIVITFSEEIDKATSENQSNYNLEPGITINSAVLQNDNKTVVLSSSTLSEGQAYTLKLANILDLASPPNSVNPTQSYTFEYKGQLVSDVTPPSYTWDSLNEGKIVYIDRSYKYESVPVQYIGMSYLQTANQDKNITDPAYVTFTVDMNVTVYVGYDARNTPVPDWLKGWEATDDKLQASHATMNLYKKEFSPGVVTISGNELGNSNYVVLTVSKVTNSNPDNPDGTSGGNGTTSDSSPDTNGGINGSSTPQGGGGSINPLTIFLVLIVFIALLFERQAVVDACQRRAK